MAKIESAIWASFVVVLAALGSAAQDWPQWRGPNRDGVVTSFVEPKVWPDGLKLKWKITVGTGHSSPVVAGEKVFLHSRQDGQEVVSGFDLRSGKLLWQDRYSAPYRMNPAATRHGEGPKSTPAIHGGKLYTFGISGVLSCYAIDSGRLRWRKEFVSRFKETSPLFGTAMSPLVDQGLLIVHVGGHDQGELAAFDSETGEVKWSWKGDGPGYASPIIVELEGARQIVTQTQQNLVAVSAANGELLWRIPFTTDYVQNIVTPVVYRQWLIFSGLSKGTTAIKILKSGNTWKTEQVWHNPDVSMYMNSPVLSGDWLFGLSHRDKGQFFSLDARTGKTLWMSAGRQGENAAMVIAGAVLFLLTNEADLIVAKKSAQAFEPLKRYHVADSPTWTHPILVGSSILIKDTSTLGLWGLE